MAVFSAYCIAAFDTFHLRSVSRGWTGQKASPTKTRVTYTEISTRGRPERVPSVCLDGATITATGKWMKVARIHDEQFMEENIAADVPALLSRLKTSGLGADLFTFTQRIPEVAPRYHYHMESEAAAVIPITTFSEWLEKRAAQDVRIAVKKAARLGVDVRIASFDTAFVRGIVDIYNESPVRQGRAFWHYQKDPDIVARENGTFLDRSTFLGAYLGEELIGFIKLVHTGRIAATLQVIGKKAHSNKKPVNALIAKAVEVCDAMGASYLRYGDYGDPANSLTEFKRRNGFEPMLLPKYYVPLTAIGRVGLGLGLQHGIRQAVKGVLPSPVLRGLRSARSQWSGHILAPLKTKLHYRS